MTVVWRGAVKEAVAIGPIWLACCIGAAAAPWWRAVGMDLVSALAYVLGSVAIGAHVVGHEYSHRTMGALLAQPLRRTTILAVKLAVLMIALLTLTAIAAAGPDSPIQRFPGHATLDSRVIYLPTLMGLTLAPYLALVARSTLGGAVFSIAVPGLLLIAGDFLGLAIHGFAMPGEVDRFKYQFFPAGTVAACVVAAAAVWRRFARLEVLDDSGGHLSLPIAARPGGPGPARSTRHPLWLLAAKEVRLQQMTFVVIAFYLVTALSLWWFERSREISPAIPWEPLHVMYGCLVSMLIGGLASAEERQFGTLAWQGLMPISRRTQFAVKVAVVLGLAIACTVALPAALAVMSAQPLDEAISRGFLTWMCLISCACALGGLYVSTVSSTGVKAVALALPFVACAVVLLRSASLAFWLGVKAGWFDRHWFAVRRVTEAEAQSIAALALLAIGVVVVMLAQRNHWSAGRSTAGVALQMTTIAAVVLAAGAAMFAAGLR
jgi:hypothetical protein